MSSSSSPWPSEASVGDAVAPSMSLSQADQEQLSHVLAEGSAAHIKFTVKWKSNVYQISLPATATLGLLKTQLSIQTSVRAAHQKLLFKTKNKLLDETLLSELVNGASAVTVLMVGSPTVDDIIAFNKIQSSDDVIDDFDIDYTTTTNNNNTHDDDDISVATNPKYIAKLIEYSNKLEITYIAPLRTNITKLLVLDLDYTLFDMYNYNNINQNNHLIDYKQLKRPYTHRFLTSVYQHYEIVIWSQTSWRWLELKLTELGMLTHSNYKILFVMDKTVMFRVESKIRNKNKRQHDNNNNNNNNTSDTNTTDTSSKRKHYVKPLALIWKHIPKFNQTNTIHIDDLSRNFAMNPCNGLKIKAYKNSLIQRNTDNELIGLAKYLYLIKNENNLADLKHDQWENYIQNNSDHHIPSIDQQPSGYISD